MTGTERKVLNKYYPPDFDPRKLPKVSVPRNRQYVIRVMAPFNMRCNTCGEYIYKGKKFNARRETVEDENYLGLSIFRFYIRCPGCLAEITFKTDLAGCDYAQEHGAKRLFEAERLLREKEAKEVEKEKEEMSNPMKMLEKRTKMSRMEMESLERLEELREINKRKLNVDHESMVQRTRESELEELRRQQDEETQLLRQMGYLAGSLPSDYEKQLPVLKRLPDIDFDEIPVACSSSSLDEKPINVSRQKEILKNSVLLKKKPPERAVEFSEGAVSDAIDENGPSSSALQSLGAYSSSSSGDDSDSSKT